MRVAVDANTRARVSRASIDRDDARIARRESRIARSRRARTAPRVVVLGGSGFVGARVVDALARRGRARDVGVARGRSAGGGERGAGDRSGGRERGARRARGGAARRRLRRVVRRRSSAATTRRCGEGTGSVIKCAIEAAKRAGVARFVYVSVASAVPDVVGKTPLMRGYFEGKEAAEACLRENYAEGDYFIVKPSFMCTAGMRFR